jgi:CubicO group peptidase (beta-lactamase class C family)
MTRRTVKRVFAVLGCIVLVLVFVGVHARWSTLIRFETRQRPGTPEARDDVLARKAHEILARFHRIGQFSGAVLIGRAGRVALCRGYGFADLERAVANTPETRFSIGSVTKQLTGFLVQELVERGKLRLSDPVARHLPELRGSAVGAVTVDQLLHMTSGLPAIVDTSSFIGVQLSRRRRSDGELLGEVAGYELGFEPGSAFRYSNVGYSLLSVIVARVAGRPWDEQLRQVIFEPHAMEDSGVLDADVPPPGLARGYLPVRSGGVVGRPALLALPRWNYSMIRGAGAVYSSVLDLHRWDRALRALARSNPRLHRRYMRPGPHRFYASGWTVKKTTLADGRRVTVCRHDGEDPGYYAYFARIPELDATIILLSNSDYGAGNTDYQLPRQLLRLVLGRPYEVVTDL